MPARPADPTETRHCHREPQQPKRDNSNMPISALRRAEWSAQRAPAPADNSHGNRNVERVLSQRNNS